MPAMLSALSVVTATALWALLALAIPLLIHLFSRSRGRLVHIGHIDLIRRARKLQVTEVKLTQWVLLALRLAIFALLALILAGLATAGLGTSNTPVIYLTPAWVQTSGRQEIDALLATAEKAPRSQVFLLQEGFPQADRQRLEAIGTESSIRAEAIDNVWPLLSERLSLEHHTGPVRVYATDYMMQFGYARPKLPRAIEWRLSHGKQAPLTNPSSIEVLIAHQQDRDADASLVIAALTALKEHRLPGLHWQTLDSDKLGEATFESDWLIYLADDIPGPAVLAGIKRPTVILAVTGDNLAENTFQYVQLPFYPYSSFRLNRFSPAGASSAITDGFADGSLLLKTDKGIPLLQERYYGPVRLLHFYSRLEPGWSTLALQSEFPELLMQLMLNPGHEPLRYADARIDPSNLYMMPTQDGAQIPLPRRSLQTLLALLLVFLWMTERWLSERKPREK